MPGEISQKERGHAAVYEAILGMKELLEIRERLSIMLKLINVELGLG